MQASCNVHKTLILLYFESAYVVYKNIQNGANYKWMGFLIHWVSPCSSGPNQTCQFHTVNWKKCTSGSPYDLKCKDCQFPLQIVSRASVLTSVTICRLKPNHANPDTNILFWQTIFCSLRKHFKEGHKLQLYILTYFEIHVNDHLSMKFLKCNLNVLSGMKI